VVQFLSTNETYGISDRVTSRARMERLYRIKALSLAWTDSTKK
jgi:hypothetical protein